MTLTTGIDTPTQGFTTGSGGTATTAGAIFQADPAAGTLGLNNTLNTGDILLATGAAAGASTLNYMAVLGTAGLLANPGYATGVTMTGISTLNISNQANLLGIGLLPSGFQGNITGLTTVNDGFGGIGSVAGVQLGNTGQGLNTVLQTVNINQFSGNPLTTGFLPVFAGYIAASKGSTTNSLAVNLNGNIGTTKAGRASYRLRVMVRREQPGAGNANLSYGTQTYDTGTNTATFLQLEAQTGGFLRGPSSQPPVSTAPRRLPSRAAAPLQSAKTSQATTRTS